MKPNISSQPLSEQQRKDRKEYYEQKEEDKRLRLAQDHSLSYCPLCYKQGYVQILGKLLPSGEFAVKRHKAGTTLIGGQQYEIRCGCGYIMNINQGTIAI